MIPEHYSRDIAQRCQYLIRHLLSVVRKGLPDDAKYGGPLGTTFLLALATPMIMLPVERIFKPANPNRAYAADDRELDPELAQEIGNVLGPQSAFGAASFFSAGRWSYVQGYRPFNLANAWPRDLLDSLATQEAFSSAERALAWRVLCDLRNALAHGGIAYLDANGHQTGGEAAMFAFAGTKLNRQGRIAGLNILRISEEDFRAFLMKWADWLAASPVQQVLNRQSALAA